jgi:SnoaL-like domain
MSIELAAFQSWLDDYGRAWESRDPRAAAELFTEAGTYRVTPFLKPMCGRKAIFEYWEHVARTEKDVRFGYEILAVTVEVCIARWWATFVIVPPGLQTNLDGIFLISLDVDRRCKSLQEWWHKQQD